MLTANKCILTAEHDNNRSAAKSSCMVRVADYKQLHNYDNLLIANLEDHKLVIWFRCPCIDVDAVRQCNDEEFNSLVLDCTQ